MLLLRLASVMLPIRKRWFLHVVEICQELSTAPRPWIEPAAGVLSRIQRVMDPSIKPRGPLETRVLRGLLLELALEWCRQIDGELSSAEKTGRLTAASVEKLWSSQRLEPGQTFLKWATELVGTLQQQNIGTADRAAAVIDADFSSSLTVAEVARAIGVSPNRLRHAFQQRFGMTVAAYRRKRRVEQAMSLLADGRRNVATVSAMVGYKSKKNFYRAVRKITGRTPRRRR